MRVPQIHKLPQACLSHQTHAVNKLIRSPIPKIGLFTRRVPVDPAQTSFPSAGFRLNLPLQGNLAKNKGPDKLMQGVAAAMAEEICLEKGMGYWWFQSQIHLDIQNVGTEPCSRILTNWGEENARECERD